MAVHRQLNMSSSRLAKSLERLSSGLRINSAADDPAGLSLSEKMRSQIHGLQQANRNIMDGLSLLQTIDGVLNEVHAILHRARDLAVQWNNSTTGTIGKQSILAEWSQLSDEIARIESSTEFNGMPLLQNALTMVTLQAGPNSGDTISFRLGDLFGPGVGNLVRPNTFFALPWLEADICGFDLHIDDVSVARGRFGAIANRLEHALAANETYAENLMAAESRIRDVDMAREMAEFTKQQILQQTGIAMLSQANQNAAAILQLLSP